jgi:hypothetical protein
MKPFERSRVVYQVNCPGCGRRIRAPSEDLRRQRVITHVRNCYAFRKADAPTVPLDLVAPPEPTP